MTQWVVRVVKKSVIERDTIPEALANCLSRAVLWHNHDNVVDIFVQKDNKEIAERLALRMSSFGYNAVVAPKWSVIELSG